MKWTIIITIISIFLSLVISDISHSFTYSSKCWKTAILEYSDNISQQYIDNKNNQPLHDINYTRICADGFKFTWSLLERKDMSVNEH